MAASFLEWNPEFEEPFEECIACDDPHCTGNCIEMQELSDDPRDHDSAYDQ